MELGTGAQRLSQSSDERSRAVRIDGVEPKDGSVESQGHTQLEVGDQKPRNFEKCIRQDRVVAIANDTSDIEPTKKFKHKWEPLGKTKNEDGLED